MDEQLKALVEKFQADLQALLPKDGDTLHAAGARDPNKERALRNQLSGILMMTYGMTSMMRDVGIPAAVLEINAIQLEQFNRVADAYWTAKGM